MYVILEELAEAAIKIMKKTGQPAGAGVPGLFMWGNCCHSNK
jgi:hypothetical protein